MNQVLAAAIGLSVLFLSASTVGATNLNCAITNQDWTNIFTALRDRYYYKTLQSIGNLCGSTTDNPEGLPAHYGSCTSMTLAAALSAQNITTSCQAILQANLYTGTGENGETTLQRAVEICNQNDLATTVHGYLCNPLRTVGCPRQVDIVKFAVFAACHTIPLANKTRQQQTQYFVDKSDINCMLQKNVCSSINEWATCPVEVQNVLDFIDETHTYTCNNTFPTVEYRCAETYEQNFELYCPPLTVLQANFYTIVVTCTVGPVVIVLFAFCLKMVYRAQHISKDEVLKQAQEGVGVGTESIKLYHPELAAVVASKYKGVSFNPVTGEWSVVGKTEKFQDEQAAARFAYLNLAGSGGAQDKSSRVPDKSVNSGTTSRTSYSTPRSAIVSNDFPVAAYSQEEPEYVVTAKPMSPEQIKERRLKQLIAFYEYWEPSKEDIPAHAENLLNRHDFEHVARAVKTKYGVLPPGWAEELEV